MHLVNGELNQFIFNIRMVVDADEDLRELECSVDEFLIRLELDQTSEFPLATLFLNLDFDSLFVLVVEN